MQRLEEIGVTAPCSRAGRIAPVIRACAFFNTTRALPAGASRPPMPRRGGGLRLLDSEDEAR